jgi:hypothetical protein
VVRFCDSRENRSRGTGNAFLDVLLAFAVTTAIFAFIPGPAMLYAAAGPWRAVARRA